jgi:DNA polymerase III sliding clamp (beta) subunit (PCNA family)
MSAPVLRHALSTVAPAMEAAASSPVLSGTLMDMGPTGTVFAATDGKILIEAAHQDIRTQDPDQRHRIIIPGATVSKVGTLLESGHGPIALASNGKTLSMRWAGEIPDHAVEVQTRSIDGAYPAYKPALQPAATSAKIRLHRAQTTNTLALLAALGTDAGRGVVLRPGDNGIGTIENLGGGSVSGNRHGTFQVPMTVVTSDGSPFSRIGFNSDLMMKALKAVPPAENESVVLSSHRGLIASGTRTIDDQSATVTALVMPITLPE